MLVAGLLILLWFTGASYRAESGAGINMSPKWERQTTVRQSARADETHHSVDRQLFFFPDRSDSFPFGERSVNESPRTDVHVVGMLGFMSLTHINRACPLLVFFLNSVLVSISVFMALSTVFHSINSPNNSPFSHSVLSLLFLPYWYF